MVPPVLTKAPSRRDGFAVDKLSVLKVLYLKRRIHDRQAWFYQSRKFLNANYTTVQRTRTNSGKLAKFVSLRRTSTARSVRFAKNLVQVLAFQSGWLVKLLS
jgi:hypothetical protein